MSDWLTEFSLSWPDFDTVVGIIGAAIVIAAYYANLQGHLNRKHWLYPTSNLVGALLIIFSLCRNPNFPAFVIEAFWAAVSLLGLVKWGLGMSDIQIEENRDGPSSQPPSVARPPAPTKLQHAIELKDFAVRRGLPVADAVLEALAKMHAGELSSKTEAQLDTIIRDLTAITWPTTTRTLDYAAGRIEVGFLQRHFRVVLFVLLVVSLSFSILGLVLVNSKDPSDIWKHVIALSVGLFGSTTYVFFNLTNVISEQAVDESDVFSSYARLIFGPAFGWLFTQMLPLENGKASQLNSMLIISFVSGFSTRLVLGIINQALQAFEITLGLNDKRRDLRGRASRR